MQFAMINKGHYWKAALVVLMLAAAVPGLQAQDRFLPQPERMIRTPELNVQFHRAETAWRSGTSLLEAKARVDRVLQALPDDVAARKLRAQVLMGMDRPREALQDAHRAVELDAKDGEAYLILSEAALRSGEAGLAVQALDVAAERIQDHADWHLRLSWIALELDLLDKAEAFARIGLALDPQQEAAYYQLSRVFVLNGKPEEAATVLAQGFRQSLLDVAVVERDSVLVRLADHPTLSPWTQQ